MQKRSKAKKAAEPMVKTSLRLPADLWTRTRIRALEQGRDAQDLVAEALASYLKKRGAR